MISYIYNKFGDFIDIIDIKPDLNVIFPSI